MSYQKITCTTPLHKIKTIRFPWDWDLNIYRGCEHHCQYCYAIYSHKYIEDDRFFSDIFIKENIAEELDKKLSSPKWQGQIINLGGVTDSYQPAEKTFEIMPKIWKVLIKHKNPVILCTKSALILRDIELIKELGNITYVNIAVTITTTDEKIAKKIEPNAPNPMERFKILEALKGSNVITGLHIMPIIPGLTDNKENIEELLKKAKACEVNYVLPGLLFLRGVTKQNFHSFLKENYPILKEKYNNWYPKGSVDKDYRNNLYKNIINPLIKKYELSTDFLGPLYQRLPPKKEKEQLTLF